MWWLGREGGTKLHRQSSPLLAHGRGRGLRHASGRLRCAMERDTKAVADTKTREALSIRLTQQRWKEERYKDEKDKLDC